MTDDSPPLSPVLIESPDCIQFKPLGEYKNDSSASAPDSTNFKTIAESEKEENEPTTDVNDEPAVRIHFGYYILMTFFTMIVYAAYIGSTSTCSQYVYYRISLKNGVPGGGLNTNKSTSICYQNRSSEAGSLTTKSQSEASSVSMAASIASGLPLIFLVVIYGAYSDKMGRKLTIIIAWLGFMAQLILHCLFVTLDWPIWVYILGTFLSSLGGSFASMLSAIFSIFADTTTRKQRSYALGILECTLGLAVVTSMMIMGVLIENLGFKSTIIIVTSLFMLSGICLFFIPETLPSKVSAEFKGKQSTKGFTNPIELFKSIIRVYTRNYRREILILLICVAMFCVFVGEMGSMSVNTLYFMNQPFCMTSFEMGIYNGVKSGVQQFVAIVLLIFVRNRFSPVTFAITGLISEVGKLFLVAFASIFVHPVANYILYASVPAGLFSGFVTPFLRSLASQTVEAHEQGVVFASIGTLEAFGVLVGTSSLSAVYKHTVHFFPGLVYFITTFCSVLGLLLTILFAIFRRRYDTFLNKS